MSGMGLVQRSFYGGVMILVIFAVRMALIGRLPKRTFTVLWGAALVRLLVPVSLPSVFSVYSFWQGGERTWELGNGFRAVAEGTGLSGIPSVWTTAGLEVQNMIARQKMHALWVGEEGSLFLIIWGAGVILCAVLFGTAYCRCLWRFRSSVPMESSYVRQWLCGHKRGHFISVRQSDEILVPLTYGVLRPVILLPGRIEWKDHHELDYVLQHEYVHICHYDGVTKLVMVAAVCIHWFNPLVWVMAGMLDRDIELACDEGVLSHFGEQSRAGYALTLIGMEEKKRGLMPLYNSFSRNAIAERIGSIMKYRKKTYVAGIMAGLLVVAVVLLFATSAFSGVTGKGADLGEKSGFVNTDVDALRIREEPYQDATVVGVLRNGQKVSIVAEEEEFYKVVIPVEESDGIAIQAEKGTEVSAQVIEGYVKKDYIVID